MLRTIPFFYEGIMPKKDKTLVSERLDFPYVITEVRVDFALETRKMLQIKVFVCSDDEVPSSGEPFGYNVFEDFSQAPYIVGDEPLDVSVGFKVERPGTWIKVYGKNLDTFPKTLDVKVTIDMPEEHLPRYR